VLGAALERRRAEEAWRRGVSYASRRLAQAAPFHAEPQSSGVTHSSRQTQGYAHDTSSASGRRVCRRYQRQLGIKPSISWFRQSSMTSIPHGHGDPDPTANVHQPPASVHFQAPHRYRHWEPKRFWYCPGAPHRSGDRRSCCRGRNTYRFSGATARASSDRASRRAVENGGLFSEVQRLQAEHV
jgi:hypothetical protein